jgi:DNA-binding SARP family transcriptional activator
VPAATHNPITRTLLRTAAAALLVLAATPTLHAQAAANTQAAPDTVISIAGPEAEVVVPADPRLNGYELAGKVLGVATGTTDSHNTTAPGQRLWVFGLQWTTTPTGPRGHVGPSVVVTGDGTQLPVPLPADADPPGGGTSPPMWFQASLPVAPTGNTTASSPNRDVTVTVTVGGYPQTFDLSTMTRRAPDPTALYRSATSWRVTQTLDATQDIPTPDTDPVLPAGLADASLPVHLHGVTLSWFAPDGASDTPASPDQAWLQVDLSSQVIDLGLGAGAYLDYHTPITAGQLILTVPGRPPLDATVFPGGGPDQSGIGVFVDRYAFPVPADLTTATLTAAPGTLQVYGDAEGGSPDTVTAQGTATFPLTLPPLPAPAPTGTSKPGTLTATPASHTEYTSAPAVHPGSDSHTGFIAAAVIAALAIAGIALLARRRLTPSPAAATTTTGWHTAPAPPPATTATTVPGKGPWRAPTPPPGPASPPPATPSSASWRTVSAPPAATAPPSVARPWTATPPPTAPVTTQAAPTPTTAPPELPMATTAQAAGTAPPPPSPPPMATPQPSSLPSPAPPPEPGTGSSESTRRAVRVLGPVEIDWQTEPQRRPVVTELVTFLACHPDRPVTTDRLRDALTRRRDDPPVTESTIRSYVSHARAALGASHITGTGGYRLVDVDVDWTQFQTLTAQARQHPERAVDLLSQALALVRGHPFADGSTWAERETLPTTIETAITEAVTSLTRLYLDAGHPHAALAAAQTGLELRPTDDPLTLAALDAAAASHQLHAFYTAHTTRLDANHQDVSPAVATHYHHLRQHPEAPSH